MSEHTLAIFLQALALVESGGNARAIGAAGERGAFQMMPAVVASSGGYGERAAARHVRLIERELLHADIEPTVFHLALAWNAGIGAVQRGQAPVRAYRHAVRVENIFNSLSRVPQPDEANMVAAVKVGPTSPSSSISLATNLAEAHGGHRVPSSGATPAARGNLSRGGSETGVPSLGSARADGLPRRSFTLTPASRSASAGVEPAPVRGGASLSRAPSDQQGQPALRPQANLAGIVFQP